MTDAYVICDALVDKICQEISRSLTKSYARYKRSPSGQRGSKLPGVVIPLLTGSPYTLNQKAFARRIRLRTDVAALDGILRIDLLLDFDVMHTISDNPVIRRVWLRGAGLSIDDVNVDEYLEPKLMFPEDINLDTETGLEEFINLVKKTIDLTLEVRKL